MFTHWLSLGAIDLVLVGLYLAAMAALALLGIYRVRLALGASRPELVIVPPLPDALPMVTVQLPLFNELHVAERLLAAVAALDWPSHRFEIQVLDDSTDATTSLVADVVARLAAQGLDVHHLRRGTREGFKAGALAYGLTRARGEFIAIFDADFVPPRDFLRALVGHFSDPTVGLVQARWEHLNRNFSLLTRLQALQLDGHFLVEQAGRARRHLFFNFNGTAGIWRHQAILDAGGWQADTLTEDLDLSYRAQLRGWRFVYRGDLVAPAELPVDIDALRGQQHRWTQGSVQAAVKLLPSILGARIPNRVKLEAVAHLTANFAYPLLLLAALLTAPFLELRYRVGWVQAWAIDLPMLCCTGLAVAAFYAPPIRAAGPGARHWLLLPGLVALGIGLAVNNTCAVLSGLTRGTGEFHRTPKLGRIERGENWRQRGYGNRTRLAPVAELLLGAEFLFLLIPWALAEGLHASLPFLVLFAAGFLGTGLSSLRSRLLSAASPA